MSPLGWASAPQTSRLLGHPRLGLFKVKPQGHGSWFQVLLQARTPAFNFIDLWMGLRISGGFALEGCRSCCAACFGLGLSWKSPSVWLTDARKWICLEGRQRLEVALVAVARRA